MSVTGSVRRALRERADNWCEKCGMSFANNAHHRKNQSQGGLDILSNLLLLCGSGTTGCHGWVTEHPELSRESGWSVLRGEDPAAKRVVYRGSWVLLDDLGNMSEAA